MKKVVGKINKKVIKLLNLDYIQELPILLGESNIIHMKKNHEKDYNKYGEYIEEILEKPDYIAKNPKDSSLEYIKEDKGNNNFVLIAVRATKQGKMFVKTLFVMSKRKKEAYIKKGYMIKY